LAGASKRNLEKSTDCTQGYKHQKEQCER